MNPKVKNVSRTILSDDWYLLEKVNFDFQLNNGQWINQNRECYDKGNGAAILLYNPVTSHILLTKQFRMPTYINGNPDGFMIEVPAGLLDGEDPSSCIKKETLEETGYKIEEVEELFELYTSPGAINEKITYFKATYSGDMKTEVGGGLTQEAEDIEVLEIPLSSAMELLKNGKIKDAKTVILLQYAALNFS